MMLTVLWQIQWITCCIRNEKSNMTAFPIQQPWRECTRSASATSSRPSLTKLYTWTSELERMPDYCLTWTGRQLSHRWETQMPCTHTQHALCIYTFDMNLWINHADGVGLLVYPWDPESGFRLSDLVSSSRGSGPTQGWRSEWACAHLVHWGGHHPVCGLYWPGAYAKEFLQWQESQCCHQHIDLDL